LTQAYLNFVVHRTPTAGIGCGGLYSGVGDNPRLRARGGWDFAPVLAGPIRVIEVVDKLPFVVTLGEPTFIEALRRNAEYLSDVKAGSACIISSEQLTSSKPT
jgi:hypothetical protein